MTKPDGLLNPTSDEFTQLLKLPFAALTSQTAILFNPLGINAFNELFKITKLPNPEKKPPVVAQLVKLVGD